MRFPEKPQPLTATAIENGQRRGPFRSAAFAYTVLVVVPIAAFSVILFLGGKFPPCVGVAASLGNNISATDAVLNLPVFLAQIAVIIGIARLCGIFMHRLGQPQVVGEMIAGLALGPSLLGMIWHPAYVWLFPPGTVRFLNALSQIGLVLFMFLVGLELNLKHIFPRARQILVVSHAGMALPMLGGGILAVFLYHNYSAADTTFAQFTLFFACAMSVTAFPVLARILSERGLANTALGGTAMACASLADVTAWALLAVAISLERGNGNVPMILWHTLVCAAIFLSVMFLVVRPVFAFFWGKMATQDRPLGRNELSVIILVILLSALSTEWFNVHAIFGAFIAGVIMPRDEKLQTEIRRRLEDILIVLLLPLFFAFTGLRTNIGLLATGTDWGVALLIMLVAVAGKLGGSAVAARANGTGWRDATALGVLMNSRGLMELVLLTIGLQDGVITPTLFTMMVLMAVITTMMTTPILSRLAPSPKAEE